MTSGRVDDMSFCFWVGLKFMMWSGLFVCRYLHISLPSTSVYLRFTPFPSLLMESNLVGWLPIQLLVDHSLLWVCVLASHPGINLLGEPHPTSPASRPRHTHTQLQSFCPPLFFIMLSLSSAFVWNGNRGYEWGQCWLIPQSVQWSILGPKDPVDRGGIWKRGYSHDIAEYWHDIQLEDKIILLSHTKTKTGRISGLRQWIITIYFLLLLMLWFPSTEWSILPVQFHIFPSVNEDTQNLTSISSPSPLSGELDSLIPNLSFSE